MYTQLKKEGAQNRSYETPKLEDLKSEYQIISLKLLECAPVSYTHLTLPTKA